MSSYHKVDDVTVDTAQVYDGKHAESGVHVPNVTEGDGTWAKGEVQDSTLKDKWWGVAFGMHFLIVVVLTIAYVPAYLSSASQEPTGDTKSLGPANDQTEYFFDDDFSYRRYLQSTFEDDSDATDGTEGTPFNINKLVLVALATLVSSLVFPAMALKIMIKHPREIISTGLVFGMVLNGVLAVASLFTGNVYGALVYGFFFLVFVYVNRYLREHIPYAAAVLRTSGTAIRANMGVVVMGYGVVVVSFGWVLWWGLVTVAVMNEAFPDDDVDEAVGGADEGGGDALATLSMYFLFLSLFWTLGVIQNCHNVTIVGVVGTFWFSPREAYGVCSSAVRDSFVRATTNSFGSICLGSLLVAIVAALRRMLYRSRRGCSIFACIIQCILCCIMHLIEYFNRWAYVYVGLYGYEFVDAGRNVLSLFKSRGCSSATSDSFVITAARMVIIAVGIVTGLFTGLLFGMAYSFRSGVFLSGFLIGTFLGWFTSRIVMYVVVSAADTVIVCFAESPKEFEKNHPALSNELQAAWGEYWEKRLASIQGQISSVSNLQNSSEPQEITTALALSPNSYDSV